MLSNDILNAVKTYTANMKNGVSLVLQTGENEKRPALKEFLSQLSSVSENLTLDELEED